MRHGIKNLESNMSKWLLHDALVDADRTSRYANILKDRPLDASVCMCKVAILDQSVGFQDNANAPSWLRIDFNSSRPEAESGSCGGSGGPTS